MFYRLAFLFSASYYLLLLIAQLLCINFEQNNGYSFYNISRIVIDNLTPFFFILILSCLFFYQNKLYFYTAKNKHRAILFSVVFTISYLIIKYLLLKLAIIFLLPKLINSSYVYRYHDGFYNVLYQLVSLIANIWLFIISAIIFYFLVKYSRRYFQTPLIDNTTQPYQNLFIDEGNRLTSNINAVEYKKLYAIIFAALFCCTSNGILWSIYFNLFSSFTDIKMIIQEYYAIIFFYTFLSVGITYWFLYRISQKLITQTYSWLPIASLLTSSAITIVLFGFIALVVSCIVLPVIFRFQSIILFILWIIGCYCLLYFLSRFSLRRYFS